MNVLVHLAANVQQRLPSGAGRTEKLRWKQGADLYSVCGQKLKKKSELLNVYIGHLPDQLERSCCSQCVKKKKRKKRVTAALIHGLKKVRVQAHFNKPEMQIQAFEIKSFTVHHSSLKTSLPYQGMEIIQTMNSDPGLAVGKVYLAFLPEYHF